MRLEPRREQSAAPPYPYRLSSERANPLFPPGTLRPFSHRPDGREKRRPAGGGALFHREQAAPASGSAVPIREDLFRRPKRAILPALEAQVPAPRFTAAAGPSRGRRGCRMSRRPCPTKPISPFWRCRRGRTPPIPSEGPSGASSPAYFQQNK